MSLLTISKYIFNNKGIRYFILIAAVVFLFMIQCSKIDRLNVEIKEIETVANRSLSNYLASQDTIKLERNINGTLVSKIKSYEFEVNTLNDKNSDLLTKYSKSLNLNKDFRNINSLISTELSIKDSIIAEGTITVIKDTINLKIVDNKNWDKYNWRKFNGDINILNKDNTFSLIKSDFKLYQGISIKMAIINENGFDKLKVSSPYPNLMFTDIENINLINDKLNNKPTKEGSWSIGFGFGYGINLNNNQVISTGPSIGVGLYYSPKWLKF